MIVKCSSFSVSALWGALGKGRVTSGMLQQHSTTELQLTQDFMPSACHLKSYSPDLHDVRGACMAGSRCMKVVDCAGFTRCRYSANFP